MEEVEGIYDTPEFKNFCGEMYIRNCEEKRIYNEEIYPDVDSYIDATKDFLKMRFLERLKNRLNERNKS